MPAACECTRIGPHVIVCSDCRCTAHVLVSNSVVCVFYDSECIPFELHAIYMCAFIFFLNGAILFARGEFFVYGCSVFFEYRVRFSTVGSGNKG